MRFDALAADPLAERLRHGVAPVHAPACARLALGDGERALALALGERPALRAGAEAFARAALSRRPRQRPWRELLTARGARRRRAGRGRGAARRRAGAAPSATRKRLEREDAERAARDRRAQPRALDRGAPARPALWLRDVACVADGAEDLVHHRPRSTRCAPTPRAAARTACARRSTLVEDTRRRWLNVTEELALEALAYRLEALLAG